MKLMLAVSILAAQASLLTALLLPARRHTLLSGATWSYRNGYHVAPSPTQTRMMSPDQGYHEDETMGNRAGWQPSIPPPRSVRQRSNRLSNNGMHYQVNSPVSGASDLEIARLLQQEQYQQQQQQQPQPQQQQQTYRQQGPPAPSAYDSYNNNHNNNDPPFPQFREQNEHGMEYGYGPPPMDYNNDFPEPPLPVEMNRAPYMPQEQDVYYAPPPPPPFPQPYPHNDNEHSDMSGQPLVGWRGERAHADRPMARQRQVRLTSNGQAIQVDTSLAGSSDSAIARYLHLQPQRAGDWVKGPVNGDEALHSTIYGVIPQHQTSKRKRTLNITGDEVTVDTHVSGVSDNAIARWINQQGLTDTQRRKLR